MKKTIVLLIALALAQAVSAQAVLRKPESIVFDSSYNRYLISNWDDGNIIMIDSIGNYSVFFSGLASAAGLHIHDNILYIASNFGDHNGVVGVDLESRLEVFYNFPAGSEFTNDITTDTSGYLYFTDTFTSRIYRIHLSDSATDILVENDIHWPNGIHFDTRHNRLLVAHNNPSTPVKAVDLSSGLITDATTTTAEWDGFGEDRLHNLYVSYSDGGTVYRFDSILTNPATIISSDHNVPEGLDFDNTHSMLCIPNMFGNTIDFLRMNVDLWIEGDTLGWVPFPVQFTGHSVYDINEWVWDFGDSDSAYTASPLHTFDVPGLYDITLRAVTTTNDTMRYVFPRYVSALADTIWTDEYKLGIDDTTFELTVFASLSHPVYELTLPIKYAGSINLQYQSFSTEGCMTEGFTGIDILSESPADKSITFRVRPNRDSRTYLMPGIGPLLKLRFSVSGWYGGSAPILFDAYGSYAPLFRANDIDYMPGTRDGIVRIPYVCGNMDFDMVVTIGDAVYIVNYVFKNGPAPLFPEASDVNCDNSCNIGDAVYLINYIFKYGPEPCAGCE